MSFDRRVLEAALAEHGKVTRVVVAAVHGSAPRDVGASMLVWPGGQSGTIGGGELEREASSTALGISEPRLLRRALGPDLGQCCGGHVSLAFEPFTTASLAHVPEKGVFARPLDTATPAPLWVESARAQHRSRGAPAELRYADGWLMETIHQPRHPLWIWGAGHVGRAVVDVLSPLPDLAITWVDTATSRFPDHIPPNITVIPATSPSLLAPHVPANAHHLILTYSHTIDLALCDALLRRPTASIGLIGSATKWARFRSRLTAMGHSAEALSGITCPIGDPALGKHPQAIALGVGHRLLTELAQPQQPHLAQKEQSA
jgi:xanthine dehydrogenase accessory factor